MQYNTNSSEQTKTIGQEIATKLKGGDIVLLYGDLGAGKTTLVKGIALGLGIEEEILSPTFTLMNLYQAKSLKSKVQSLIHIDTYRLKNEQDLIDIGIEDYLAEKNTICIIEWPGKIENLLKNKKCIEIKISHFDKDNRKIEINNL